MKLWIGDIEEGDFVCTVDAIFTDPPWNPGIARMFRKWAGHDRTVDLKTVARMASVQIAIACPKGPWYIEVGPNPEPWLTAIKGVSEGPVRAVKGTWGPSRNPFHMLCANGAPPISPGLYDEEGMAQAFRHFDQLNVRTIGDPFVGRGMTICHAKRHGMEVWGMDLNPQRIDEARRGEAR